jgi:hypothetical protein
MGDGKASRVSRLLWQFLNFFVFKEVCLVMHGFEIGMSVFWSIFGFFIIKILQ